MTYRTLIQGFRRFKKTYFQSEKRHAYQQLVQGGQRPETLVIACSDSRIDPAILTDSEPGMFFSVRNVAALVPPCKNTADILGTSSAIEYAVRCLKVKHIIVLGHSQCGGIETLAMENLLAPAAPDLQFVPLWLNIAAEAKAAVFSKIPSEDKALRRSALEQASILVSMTNLLSFPWIRDRCESGDLHIHGWYFDMTKGMVLEYQPDHGCFRDIADQGTVTPFTIQDSALHHLVDQCCAHTSQTT